MPPCHLVTHGQPIIQPFPLNILHKNMPSVTQICYLLNLIAINENFAESENSLVQVRSDSKNYTEKNDIDAEVLAGSHLHSITKPQYKGLFINSMLAFCNINYLIQCLLEPNIGVFHLISHLVYL